MGKYMRSFADGDDGSVDFGTGFVIADVKNDGCLKVS